MIGVVLQDDQLLAGSIADNICFFAPQPDRALIEQCARLAAIHDEIVAMPMGYESLVGDMGSSISGGQKQRILLARALYRRPRILLLDEATSHLDIALERAVNTRSAQLSITRIVDRPPSGDDPLGATRDHAAKGGRIESDERIDPERAGGDDAEPQRLTGDRAESRRRRCAAGLAGHAALTSGHAPWRTPQPDRRCARLSGSGRAVRS